MKSIKKFFLNILMVLVSILIALYLVELFLSKSAIAKPFNGKCDRKFIESLQNLKDNGSENFNKNFKEPQFIENCPYPKKNLKDAYQVTWGYVVKNNSQYFRWREFKKPLKNQISIVILGDSMTWGVGMPLTKSYPYLVEKRLNKLNNSEFVVNSLAIPGGTIDQHLANLKQYLDILEPDIIVLGLYHNDIESTKKAIEKKNLIENIAFNFINFLKKIKLVRVSQVFHNFFDMYLPIRISWEDFRDYAYFNKNSWHWLNFKNNLREIKTISDNKNLISPIIASLNGPPGQNIIDFDEPTDNYKKWMNWHKELEKEGCYQGYYVFDQIEEISKKFNKKNLAVNEWDYHPNEDLHDLYADNLIYNILKLLELGKKDNYC